MYYTERRRGVVKASRPHKGRESHMDMPKSLDAISLDFVNSFRPENNNRIPKRFHEGSILSLFHPRYTLTYIQHLYAHPSFLPPFFSATQQISPIDHFGARATAAKGFLFSDDMYIRAGRCVCSATRGEKGGLTRVIAQARAP